MSSPVAARIGSQQPRIEIVPPAPMTAGDDAIDLAAVAGLHLDPWQQHVVRAALRERADGKWAAFEVGLIVPRQNGKNAILEAVELNAAIYTRDQLVVHSAHDASTALSAFQKLKKRIQATPALLKRVRGYRPDVRDLDDISGFRLSNQERGIQFKNGSQIVYRTRTSGGGRGLTGDLVVIDEAYALTNEQIAALLPTMAARSIEGNPQIWYTSSAGLADSDFLAGLRKRGIEQIGADRLAYFEWSAPKDADPLDRNAWYMANPGLGIRISEEYVASEYAAFLSGDEEGGLTGFNRERLGIWEEPADARFITDDMLETVRRPAEQVEDVEILAFGVDVSPKRDIATIALAGFLPDGSIGVTVVDRRAGTSWLPHRLSELRAGWDPVAVAGLAGSVVEDMLPQMRRNRVGIRLVTWKRYAQSCARLYEGMLEDRAGSAGADEIRVYHSGQAEVMEAFANVTSRGSKDGLWTWSRIDKVEDITPVVAITLAIEGLMVRGKKKLEGRKSGTRVKVWG